MAYSIRVPVFEGPLDLLLHLIRTHKLDIRDIPIAQVTEQYLEYLAPCFCGRRHQSARLEYSDGLQSITLFQCGHPDCSSADNCFGPGPNDASVRHKGTDGYWYRAVGDAPRSELERMVKSAG